MVGINGENIVRFRENAGQIHIDAVFQETWLLVLDISNGRSVIVDNALFKRCCQRVESARALLSALPKHLVDELLFAQCALIDEAVKTMPGADVSVWYSQPLQSRFFDRIDAGEAIFERIRRLLRDPAPRPELIGMYQRLLLLGFRGEYRGGKWDECQEMMRQLEALLPREERGAPPADVVVTTGNNGSTYWRSGRAMLAFMAVFTTLLWAGLRLCLLAQLEG